MQGAMRFVRVCVVFVAALPLPLGVAVPAGAMQQGTASAAKQATTAAAQVSAQSRASALAARRALVRKDLSVSKQQLWRAPKWRRLGRSTVTD